ncbi:HD-GYP domain-containing protein [Kineothrix sp. MB12-C1]|uniref:HD-GYP domain-containing protein n=1 Tax=Kineothrix sp. MB12-C1 TaxID=3070215 RepID=UPI0027D1FDA3|nr:HD domain-containing phosphohydrolase [Kineothrix sp. MB12-C1]WMC91089.1 HD domain-containing phosphohydrolase [Kineothrix sp. MB12-C1]
MKVCKIEDLSGGEVLSRAVLTSNYRILLAEGTILRKEYIEKLNELGVSEVYIRDQINTEEVVLLKNKMEIDFKDKVRTVMEKHTYTDSKELVELSKVADNIINNILEEEEVIERVYDIKERSEDLYEHSINICSMAILTSLKMKIPQKKIHDISVASLLHDLGHRYLIINYANQDVNELPAIELAEYKKHPIYGYSALKREPWISELSKTIILYHHEKLDGSGYPLRATDIPLEARIVNVCDSFDEMICGIGCKRTRVYEAIEHLKKNKNILYDGRIVDAFLQFAAVYPVGSYVLTNEKEIGIVLRQNKNNPDKPFIKIIFDDKGERILHDIVKDLSVISNIYIEKVIEDIK